MCEVGYYILSVFFMDIVTVKTKATMVVCVCVCVCLVAGGGGGWWCVWSVCTQYSVHVTRNH